MKKLISFSIAIFVVLFMHSCYESDNLTDNSRNSKNKFSKVQSVPVITSVDSLMCNDSLVMYALAFANDTANPIKKITQNNIDYYTATGYREYNLEFELQDLTIINVKVVYFDDDNLNYLSEGASKCYICAGDLCCKVHTNHLGGGTYERYCRCPNIEVYDCTLEEYSTSGSAFSAGLLIYNNLIYQESLYVVNL